MRSHLVSCTAKSTSQHYALRARGEMSQSIRRCSRRIPLATRGHYIFHEGEELRDRVFVHRKPVLVKCVHQVRIKRWSKHFKVPLSLGAAQKDQMVAIYFTDAGDNFPV